MKPRVEELMYHAGLTAHGCWDTMDDYDREAIEKFVELIVGECLGICATVASDPEIMGWGPGAQACAREITHRLGVE